MKIFKNQVKTGNRIFNTINRATDQPLLLLLCAPPQAGKTGAIIYTLEQVYSRYKAGETQKPNILFIGPSDKVLRDQTQERVGQSDAILSCLVGGRVWHAPDTYNTKNKEWLERLIGAMAANGEPLIVVWDEAHIGIGTSGKNGALQKLPEFFKNVVGSLPGLTQHPHVKHLMVTATPFAQDVFQQELLKGAWGHPIEEIPLETGKGYTSFKSIKADNRFRPHLTHRIPKGISAFKKKEMRKQNHENFQPGFIKILKDFKQEYDECPKWGVVRNTMHGQMRYIIKCCDEAGIPCELFEAKSKNIKEFETRLAGAPEECKILLIKQSYKQGKTLEQKHIGMWYENDTRGGRHDADVIQSVGRCCGYSGPYTFPIYCDVDIMDRGIKYYDMCAVNDLAGKRETPMNCTHTRHEYIQRRRREKIVGNSFEEVHKELLKRGISHEDINKSASRCSVNNSADVAREITTTHRRQGSHGGTQRYNIRHMDKANPNHLRSWDSAHEYHGKFVVVLDKPHMVEELHTKNKSYFSLAESVAP